MTETACGAFQYYDSVRINLGVFQHDVNVRWDLAVHDLSIIDCVLDGPPIAVSATGLAHVGQSPENIAYLTTFFERTLIAHVHVNWLAPVRFAGPCSAARAACWSSTASRRARGTRATIAGFP